MWRLTRLRRTLCSGILLLCLSGFSRANPPHTVSALVEDHICAGGPSDYTQVRHIVLKGSNEAIGYGLASLAQKHHGLKATPSHDAFRTRVQRRDRPESSGPAKSRPRYSDYLEFALRPAGIPPHAAPPRTASEKSRTPAEAFASIVESYRMKQQAIVSTFQNAKTEAQKRSAWDEYRQGGKEFAPQVLRLAEKDPEQPFVPEALAWLVINAHDTPEASRAVELMLRHYPTSSRLAGVCDALVS